MAGAEERYTEKQHYRDPMNRNATHTSTDHSKGNDLKGCAMHRTRPSILNLPLCPSLRRPFHPALVSKTPVIASKDPVIASKHSVIASEAKQSLNFTATDKANCSIIVSTSAIMSTSSRHCAPFPSSLRAKRSNPKQVTATHPCNKTTTESKSMNIAARHPPTNLLSPRSPTQSPETP